jgi:hypothetical protein
MMNKFKIIFLVFSICIFVFMPHLWADDSKVGTTAYSFLKIGIGARSQAMGSAFVGLSDDESALYFNPAGILQLNGRSFILSYNNYLTDIQSGFVGFIHPYSDRIRLGAWIDYMNFGSMVETDSTGKRLGTFGAGDLAVGLTYAQSLSPMFNIGLTGKFIYGKIQDYSSDALAVDLGLLLRFKDKRSKLGLAVRNLGVQLKGYTESHKESLPTVFELGLSHHLRGFPLIFSFDTAKPIDNDYHFDFGGEYLGFKPLFLRLGWTSLGENFKTDSDKDNLAGFSGGFGLLWRNYQFDYAYSSFADLGSVHRLTISGQLR